MAAIDGLASGLQTTELINSLMQIEANPQTLLKQKQVRVNSAVSAFQTLNSTVANLRTNAEKLTGATKIDAFTAASSDESVRIKAGAGAGAGTLSFRVDRTAQGQTAVTAAMRAWSSDPAVLTVRGADGEAHEITAASGSIADIATAVNAADLGVTATRVSAGKDADGEPLYRLQFASKATGAEQAFEVFAGSKAEVEAGTAASAFANGGAVVHEARDAAIALWPGSGAEQLVTSSSNTFSSVLEGLDVTVSKASTDPVTVTVARDASAISGKVGGLVTNLTASLNYIGSLSSVTTAANGTRTAGVFNGDGTARDAKNQLTSTFTAPIDGVSPSEYGINVDKAGVVTFDAARFETALAEDPDAVLGAVAALATRIHGTTKTLSDPTTGTITAKVTGQQSQAKDLTSQIERWDDRLANRRATLERTYATLEVTLSNLQSQGNWLAGQLATLPNLNTNRSNR